MAKLLRFIEHLVRARNRVRGVDTLARELAACSGCRGSAVDLYCIGVQEPGQEPDGRKVVRGPARDRVPEDAAAVAAAGWSEGVLPESPSVASLISYLSTWSGLKSSWIVVSLVRPFDPSGSIVISGI